MDIKTVKTRFHNGKGQWIYAPEKVKLELDNDLLVYNVAPSDDVLIPAIFKTNQRSRYIRLRVPNYGVIPDGKQGAGNKAWTFIDEIVIN